MFSAVSVAVPPASEPVDLPTARLHLRVDQAGDDALIAAYITAARTWCEQYLGRALIAQQLVWTVSRDCPPGGSPWLAMPLSLLVLPLWFQWPLSQSSVIALPWQPVISVDKVAYGQYGQADTVLVASTDYDVDPATARLSIHPYSQVLPNDHLQVTFTVGYGNDASGVPAPIVIAVLMLMAFLYENRGDAGGDLPRAVEMLLAPYRIVRFD